jgi:hypothetical protein
VAAGHGATTRGALDGFLRAAELADQCLDVGVDLPGLEMRQVTQRLVTGSCSPPSFSQKRLRC